MALAAGGYALGLGQMPSARSLADQPKVPRASSSTYARVATEGYLIVPLRI